MIYRRLTNYGDYSFGRNMQNFIGQKEAIAQAIKTRLLLFKEEWWEDRNEGLPMFQSILAQPGGEERRNAVDLLVRDRITGTIGITGILEFESSIVDRRYNADCKALTIDNEVAEVSM